MQGHKTAEARSLAYHRAIAARLASEPQLVVNAMRRVTRWAVEGSVHSRWIQGWQRWLALPVNDLARWMVDEGQESIDLRQATPFAGALSPAARWAIIRALREAR